MKLLIDLDGTIGDSLSLCIAAFREAIEPLLGREVSAAEIIATFGPSEEGTIAQLLPGREEEGMSRYLARYEALHGQWPDPFPGMKEALQFVKDKGGFVGLVTGKGPKSNVLTLRRYGMEDFFDVVKTGSVEGPVKDRLIQEIIAAFGFSNGEVLYVGDAPSDITASRACGVRVAAAAWGPLADADALRAMEPDYLFTSVAEFDTFLHEALDG